MFMVKFSPTALNFGYDFVLLVHFLGHPVDHVLLYFLYLFKDLSVKQCGINQDIPIQYFRTISNAIFEKRGICKR